MFEEVNIMGLERAEAESGQLEQNSNRVLTVVVEI